MPATESHTSKPTESHQPATTRLEVRIPVEIKELIEQAARAVEATTTGFVLHAARQAAEEVMRRDQVTVVPPDFYEAMMASLAEPAEPNDALVEAARRSREIVRKK